MLEGVSNPKEKIVITGGTEGIGRAITEELAAQKHNIVICARTQERLEGMKKDLGVNAYQIDLSDTDKIKDFIDDGAKQIGGVTILILNAAVTGIREDYDYTYRVVCDAQKKLVESASDFLRKTNGRIVFLTSGQARNLVEGHEHYGKAKKEVEDFLEEFSKDPENKNINIFLVNPGQVDTRMNEEAIAFGKGAIKERSIKAKEKGLFRNPKTIGRIISKMSLTGKKFNPETREYDISIANNEIVRISDENIEFEEKN